MRGLLRYLEEEPFEFLAEDDVDDEIDGRVDGDEQVAQLHHLHRQVDGEALEQVVHQSQNVAHEEDGHHAQKHHRKADFATLQPRETLPLGVSTTHLNQTHHPKQPSLT